MKQRTNAKNEAKTTKSDDFTFELQRKVQYCYHNIEKNIDFDSTKLISYFGGTNNIFFVEIKLCIMLLSSFNPLL